MNILQGSVHPNHILRSLLVESDRSFYFVCNDCSTDAVHQLGEGTGGVPAAPLLMKLWQRREEVLEGADTPRPRPGTAVAILD